MKSAPRPFSSAKRRSVSRCRTTGLTKMALNQPGFPRPTALPALHRQSNRAFGIGKSEAFSQPGQAQRGSGICALTFLPGAHEVGDDAVDCMAIQLQQGLEGGAEQSKQTSAHSSVATHHPRAEPQQCSCCLLACSSHLAHAKCAHAYATAPERDCVHHCINEPSQSHQGHTYCPRPCQHKQS